ncbi:HNH endonuclease signature motif containing protein [Paraburkholderia elongata]|uniref:HNH endonuclease signature motif containing protein n=1 Tax=Paraburkholderia elongata TaxID=2675747 RepID=UPI0038B38000
MVDHKVPHRGDMALFRNVSNWQALSKRCHDAKTDARTVALATRSAPATRRAIT